MGSTKNKRNFRNSHRHVFKNRRTPKEKQRRTSTKKIKSSEHQEAVTINGSRIINIDKLKQYVNDLTLHSARCGGSFTLSCETRQGLASILTGHCTLCKHSINLETSRKVKGPRQYQRWEYNLAAVWGQMVTGGGHSHLKETMSVLGVPVMTQASFINTERAVGNLWTEKLEQSMIEAGAEEKSLAIERGSYSEGVPAITVIVDGGWSK